MIEYFTLSTFKLGLPLGKGGKPLFEHIGLVMGEHCFVMQTPNPKIRLLVRSTIDISGLSAKTGEDSIRVIIQRKVGEEWRGIGKTVDAYTTRVPGWSKRLTAKIKEVYFRAAKIKKDFDDTEVVCFCKKAGPNFGRPLAFQVDAKNSVRWLDK